MKHLSYITTLLTLITIGCNSPSTKDISEKIYYEDIQSFMKNDLNLHLLEMEEELMAPKKIWIHESMLIINDEGYSDGFLSFYSLNTGTLVTRYGRRGEGPDDYFLPRFNKTKDMIQITAINNKSNLLSLKDIPSINLLKYEPLRNELFYESDYLFLINDSLILGCQTLETQFVLLNNKTGVKEDVKDYLPLSNSKKLPSIFNKEVFDAFYNIHPCKKNIVAVYKYYPMMDILDLSDFTMKRIEFKNNHTNSYSIIEDGSTIKFNNPILQYTFSYCTKNNIYLLFQNANRKELKDNKYKSEIHIFDWEGNFQRRLSLDIPLYNFAITDDNLYLYGLGLDSEFTPQIYYTKLE